MSRLRLEPIIGEIYAWSAKLPEFSKLTPLLDIDSKEDRENALRTFPIFQASGASDVLGLIETTEKSLLEDVLSAIEENTFFFDLIWFKTKGSRVKKVFRELVHSNISFSEIIKQLDSNGVNVALYSDMYMKVYSQVTSQKMNLFEIEYLLDMVQVRVMISHSLSASTIIKEYIQNFVESFGLLTYARFLNIGKSKEEIDMLLSQIPSEFLSFNSNEVESLEAILNSLQGEMAAYGIVSREIKSLEKLIDMRRCHFANRAIINSDPNIQLIQYLNSIEYVIKDLRTIFFFYDSKKPETKTKVQEMLIDYSILP